jgi:hypothetical protein
MLNNGIHGAALITTPVEGGWSQANGSVSTYTLPPASGNGWDISNITTIADWGGASGFANQRYEVAVRRVWEAGFSTLASVNYQPFTATGIGGSKVQITQPGSKLAVGVAQIRFTMLTTNGNSGRAVYREFDVFGTQSVTPPARILAIAAPAGGGPMTSITWSSHPQKTYKVESSENLQQWSVLDPVFTSGGVTTTYRAFPGHSPPPRAFCRVSANP